MNGGPTLDGESFYDRNGEPIDQETWVRYRRDDDYRRIARTVIEEGTVVSTVWTGTDLKILDDDEPAWIFETALFGPTAEGTWQYSTEAEARAGHDRIVARVHELRRRPPT